MRKIIITEDQLDYIKSNKPLIENNSSEIFNKEVRHFIYNLLNKNLDEISDYWRINGLKKSEIFNKLKRYGIIEIKSDDEILVPKKNFNNKINRLYFELFPEQEPGLIISEDDGGGDNVGNGATSAMNSGSYEVPLFGKPITRKINNT